MAREMCSQSAARNVVSRGCVDCGKSVVATAMVGGTCHRAGMASLLLAVYLPRVFVPSH